MEKYKNTLSYLNLKKVNDSLMAENARIRSQLTLYNELQLKDSLFTDSTQKIRYLFKPAMVVNNSYDKKKNFITINKGEINGISANMGVITTNGIAGIVKKVSKNYALVISVLNNDFRVNAKIVETGEIGSVTWNGHSPEFVTMQDIPSHVKLKKGDHVVVGPFSNSFPENTVIGLIESFNFVSGGSFYEIKVKLVSPLRNVSKVYLVEKLGTKEQLSIENQK